MRRILICSALLLLMAVPASAQKLNLDQLIGLADKADEVVDITLDAEMLRLASKFFKGEDADERAIREMITGLEGIYVRAYEFSEDGQYDRAIPDRLRSQLGPNWKPMVTVRSRKKENVNIMADMRGDRVHGLVIIAAEPRELVVVNIVGNIDIERLADLEGQFGIPKITEEDRR
jgi:hypothetical protein